MAGRFGLSMVDIIVNIRTHSKLKVSKPRYHYDDLYFRLFHLSTCLPYTTPDLHLQI